MRTLVLLTAIVVLVALFCVWRSTRVAAPASFLTAQSSPAAKPLCNSVHDCGAGACVRGACVECARSSDCGSERRCQHGVCLHQCFGDANCAATPTTPHCVRGGCVECVRAADCSAEAPFCALHGECVECLSSASCAPGLTCLRGACVLPCASAAECVPNAPECVDGACAAYAPGVPYAGGLGSHDGSGVVECLVRGHCTGAFTSCPSSGSCARATPIFHLSTQGIPPVASRAFLAVAPAFPEAAASALMLSSSCASPATVWFGAAGSDILVRFVVGTDDGAAYAALTAPQNVDGIRKFLLTPVAVAANPAPPATARLSDTTGNAVTLSAVVHGATFSIQLGDVYIGADGAASDTPCVWTVMAL